MEDKKAEYFEALVIKQCLDYGIIHGTYFTEEQLNIFIHELLKGWRTIRDKL